MTDEPLIDKNCLSYWFPKLAATGIRVPKTTILYAHYKDGDGLRRHVEFERGLDGLDVPGLDEFVAMVRTEADEIGYPCFLRSGLTSGKHNWENLLCDRSRSDRLSHHEPDAPRFPKELIELLIDMAANGSASPENVEFRHYHNTPDNDCYRLRRQIAPEELQMTSQLNPDQFMLGRHWRFI